MGTLEKFVEDFETLVEIIELAFQIDPFGHDIVWKGNQLVQILVRDV